MTLQQFFEWVQLKPIFILYYFGLFFLLTLLICAVAGKDLQMPPWNTFLSGIIYAVCIPGIFSITLNVYFFLFEKRSILETELLLQVLPVFMMILTLYVIKRNVDLDYIPGFDRLGNLMWIIGIIFSLMWVIDRTHLYAISFVPFYYVLLFLIGAIIFMRFSFKKMIR